MPGYALFVAGAANSDRRVELLAVLIFREQLENDRHQLLKTIPGLNKIHNGIALMQSTRVICQN